MASNRKSRIPSAQRDALSGEPLHRATARAALLDHDPTRHPAHQTPIPMRLHTRQEETVEGGGASPDRLGSHQFSRPMLHYLREGERSAARQEREWWNMPYILDRLWAYAGPPPAPFTLDEMQAALHWYRGGDFADSDRTGYWIERACRRVQRFVRATYLDTEARGS